MYTNITADEIKLHLCVNIVEHICYPSHRQGEPAERWSEWSCPDPFHQPKCRSAFSHTW